MGLGVEGGGNGSRGGWVGWFEGGEFGSESGGGGSFIGFGAELGELFEGAGVDAGTFTLSFRAKSVPERFSLDYV